MSFVPNIYSVKGRHSTMCVYTYIQQLGFLSGCPHDSLCDALADPSKYSHTQQIQKHE